MKWLLAAAILGVFLINGDVGRASGGGGSPSGVTTPTSIQMDFSGIALNDVKNNSTIVSTSAFSVTFRRTDKDFAAVPLLTDVAIPAGRYQNLTLTISTQVKVSLDGTTYVGTDLNNVFSNVASNL